MIQNVPAASIIGMAISLVISIGLPVAALIIVQRRVKGRLISVLVGAVTFVVFAMVLEQLLHTAMLSVFGDSLTENVLLLALYGGLAAGIFEETGRYLAMRFVMRGYLSEENAVLYGIGHGGIECILILGLSEINNIITSIMINTGLIETTLSMLDDEMRETVLSQISALWTTAPSDFYLAGVERISAFFLHICLSYLVYLAVSRRRAAYYVLAVMLHFAVDCGTVLMMRAISLPVAAVEVILLAVAAAVGYVVFRLRRRLRTAG